MKKELLDKVVALLTDIRSDKGFSSMVNEKFFNLRIDDTLLCLSLYEYTTTVGNFNSKKECFSCVNIGSGKVCLECIPEGVVPGDDYVFVKWKGYEVSLGV